MRREAVDDQLISYDMKIKFKVLLLLFGAFLSWYSYEKHRFLYYPLLLEHIVITLVWIDRLPFRRSFGRGSLSVLGMTEHVWCNFLKKFTFTDLFARFSKPVLKL